MTLKKIFYSALVIAIVSTLSAEKQPAPGKTISMSGRIIAAHEAGLTQKVILPGIAAFSAYDLWRKYQNERKIDDARFHADKDNREISEEDEMEMRNEYGNLFVDLSLDGFSEYYRASLMGEHSKLNCIQAWTLLYIFGQYGYKGFRLLRNSKKRD